MIKGGGKEGRKAGRDREHLKTNKRGKKGLRKRTKGVKNNNKGIEIRGKNLRREGGRKGRNEDKI